MLVTIALGVNNGISQPVISFIGFTYNGYDCRVDTNGIANCFDTSGNIISQGGMNVTREGIFKPKKWVKSGQWTYFYPNGQIKSYGVYCKDVKSGYWTILTQNAMIRKQDFHPVVCP